MWNIFLIYKLMLIMLIDLMFLVCYFDMPTPNGLHLFSSQRAMQGSSPPCFSNALGNKVTWQDLYLTATSPCSTFWNAGLELAGITARKYLQTLLFEFYLPIHSNPRVRHPKHWHFSAVWFFYRIRPRYREHSWSLASGCSFRIWCHKNLLPHS